MNHSDYSKAAEDALAHVRSSVRYRGLNTAGGWIRHPTEAHAKTAARMYSMVLGAMRSARYGGSFDGERYIRETARLAIEAQTGNCSELSSVAFLRLAARQVAPIDYFAVFRGDWNHAFVVLNRDDSIPVANFADWSYRAVVCDPLYDRSGDAGNLVRWYPKMFPLKDTDVWFRLTP